jgi:hypothetical protein
MPWDFSSVLASADCFEAAVCHGSIVFEATVPAHASPSRKIRSQLVGGQVSTLASGWSSQSPANNLANSLTSLWALDFRKELLQRSRMIRTSTGKSPNFRCKMMLRIITLGATTRPIRTRCQQSRDAIKKNLVYQKTSIVCFAFVFDGVMRQWFTRHSAFCGVCTAASKRLICLRFAWLVQPLSHIHSQLAFPISFLQRPLPHHPWHWLLCRTGLCYCSSSSSSRARPTPCALAVHDPLGLGEMFGSVRNQN